MADTLTETTTEEEVVPSVYTTETGEASASASTGTDAAPGRPAAHVTRVGSSGATGRRKEAIARVRIVPGTGNWTINGRSLEVYFPNKVHQQLVKSPFTTLAADGMFDVLVRVGGGGPSGQAGAVRLGVARALIEVDAENRPPLKSAGFLTRDARVKERKKYGLKKARKAPQYSKR